MLIANALLVPAWATWKHFRDLEDRGLTMCGQMTAGSWIYIGTQGILKGYETLAALARRHFGGTLRGRLTVTAGLGGMGGAQPLAVTMNEGVALVVEVDAARIERRLDTRYLDEATDSLDDALARARVYCQRGEARSIGLEANAADVIPALVARGVTPDVLTDQTSAHDALKGYVPNGLTLSEAARLRDTSPDEYVRRSMAAMAATSAACSSSRPAARSRSTTVTTSARRPNRPASHGRSTSRVSSEFVRPLFCEGRAVPLGRALGRSGRHPRNRQPGARDVRRRRTAVPVDRMAGERVAFQGLPARIFWLGMASGRASGLP